MTTSKRPPRQAKGNQSAGSRPKLLGATLTLGDVDDAEKLARKVLNDRLGSMGAYLNPTEYDDALSYLIAECWRLYQRYDASKGTQTFSTFAYRILWRRVACWYRQRFGDSRHRKPAEWVSLDDDDLDAITADWEWYEDPRLSAHKLDGAPTVNLELLTPQSQKIYQQIAYPHAFLDQSLQQIADRLGQTRRWVSKALQVLRAELEQNAALADQRGDHP